MPTVLSEGDHSLSSLSIHAFEVPPPGRLQDLYFHHSFPTQVHPSLQHQFQHFSSESLQTTSSARSSKRPQELRRFPSTITTPKARPKRKPRIPKQHYKHGPKWIHRQGFINGINYHWVETTGIDDDDGAKPTDKPLVVLLHGFPQFWYAWRHQIVPLGEAGYRVVVPDLRGFNLTDKPTAPKHKGFVSRNDETGYIEAEDHAAYDMETLTADIRALILHLGHSEANIVGHDWGGIIAWAFAARFPQHTTKLVVINAPHLCRWRDVAMDYTSASCAQQAWWTCWYTLCCQLLPSWIAESILSYQRSWILTQFMTTYQPWRSPFSCTENPMQDGSVCASSSLSEAQGFRVPDGGGGGGCSGCWKPTDMDLYRDAISKPGAIYALLEYYRNLWLSLQQMEHYGKIHEDLPILVLWGLKDKTFPPEMSQGWEEWIDCKDHSHKEFSSAPSLTVSYLDCGHFPPEEIPNEVNQRLVDFFRQPLPLLSAEL